jgi:hypothetical protein
MSFQDVGRAGGGRSRNPTQRRGPQQGNTGGAFSSAAAAGGGNGRTSRSIDNNNNTTTTAASSGYEQLSDSILQYQKNVALLERMSRKFNTPEDTSVLQTQYTLQIDVINQLGTRIETQLQAADKRLGTLSRGEAAQCRTTHVKLNRDYRMVEQKFKNVQLDVRQRKSLAEAKVREARMEEERRRIEQQQQQRNNGGGGQRGIDLMGGGGAGGNAAGIGGGNMTEEGMRWQMQIQEDVSFKFCFRYVAIILDKFITLIKHLSSHTPKIKPTTHLPQINKTENQRRNHA